MLHNIFKIILFFILLNFLVLTGNFHRVLTLQWDTDELQLQQYCISRTNKCQHSNCKDLLIFSVVKVIFRLQRDMWTIGKVWPAQKMTNNNETGEDNTFVISQHNNQNPRQCAVSYNYNNVISIYCQFFSYAVISDPQILKANICKTEYEASTI